MLTSTERTSNGLREMLFDEIDKLRNGVIDSSRAHATAKLAQQILSSVSLELAAKRMFEKVPTIGGKLPGLKLVSDKEAA